MVASVDGALTPEEVSSPPDEEPEAPKQPILPRLEKSAIGVRRADGVMVSRREPAGCVLYGPHWQLPAGHYQLSFSCTAGPARMSSQPVLGVEVIVLNRIQQAWQDFTASELQTGSASILFEVPPALGLEGRNEGRFEFKFFHLGNADLRISTVDLTRLPNQAGSSLVLREWRMLGRLQKSWLGKRRADGTITTNRREPPGYILYGGWPYLRLPGGHYRLSVDCEAATPRFASHPVFGLEILGRSRWRSRSVPQWLMCLPATGGILHAWRDFTAEELSNGRALVEFEVPTDMALEAGDDAPFEFRLFHTGNADLAITAVNLCCLGREQVESAISCNRRLLGSLQKRRSGLHNLGRATVPSMEHAKPLAYGAEPPLRLPEGRYQLSFCCRKDMPSSPAADPAVRAQVIAGMGGWRRLFGTKFIRVAQREFRAEDLRAGSASFEFEMPTELGRERSEAQVELAFIGFGNGDLTISDVEIREATDWKAGSPLASIPATGRRRLRRKQILFVGNCQSDLLCQGFNRIESLSTAFRVKYHFVMLPKSLHELAKRDLEATDILMIQDLRDWENFPLRDYVREDVEQVCFPGVRFASLWPFDGWNGPGDKEAHDREAPNLTFPYLDTVLGRLRKEIPDKEERWRAYSQLNIAGVVNYRRLHDLEERRLVGMDKKFGMEIGAFVLDNFRKKRIFHTTVRPRGDVLNMLMNYLLHCIGIDTAHNLPESIHDMLRTPQIPVHPKVARDLGVRWADENTRYLYGGEYITWETYIRRYIDHYG